MIGKHVWRDEIDPVEATAPAAGAMRRSTGNRILNLSDKKMWSVAYRGSRFPASPGAVAEQPAPETAAARLRTLRHATFHSGERRQLAASRRPNQAYVLEQDLADFAGQGL